MFANTSKRDLAVPMAILAVFMMIMVGAVIASEPSDAVGEDLSETYPDASTIELAPGYKYTYTATFPSDLTEGTVLSFELNELDTYATISGHTLTVTIPTGYSTGFYNVVLKAYHELSDQTKYQYIRFHIVDEMALAPTGAVNDILYGASQTITFAATGGLGDVTYEAVATPSGMTFAPETATFSGTPDTYGEQTVTIKATSSEGQVIEDAVNFTVYDIIQGGSAQTITSINGETVSSDAIEQAGNTDLGITWEITGDTQLPVGFNLNPSTGVISGGSSTYNLVTVTITGTTTNGPVQTATKQVTIQSEPEFILTGGSAILTYVNNSEAVTSTVTPTSGTSTVTWGSSSEIAGVSVSDGTVTAQNVTQAGMGQSYVVTAQTAFGQSDEITVTLNVEDTLAISGDETLYGTAGTAATSAAFTVSGGSSNELSVTNDGGFSTATISEGALMINNESAHAGTVIVTVTSAAGQTATIEVTAQLFSGMEFTSQPSAGSIVYAMQV